MRWTTVLALVFGSHLAKAELEGNHWFVGSSAFVLFNLDRDTDEPPDFYQLNIGYQISKKDTVSLELITWTYYAPHGYLYSKASDKKYPGSVKGMGPGLAYQRFIWRDLYVALHAAWMKQEYRDSIKQKLAEGEQLFMAFRLGYHIEFGKNFFVEPSMAVTSWPIQRHLPASFKEKEDGAPKFTAEPGLHFGVIF